MKSSAADPSPAATPSPAPVARPCWYYATDVPKYDPIKTLANDPAAATPASIAAAKPLVFERFDDADAARLERMYAKLRDWREEQGLGSLVQRSAESLAPEPLPPVPANPGASPSAEALHRRRNSSAAGAIPLPPAPPFATTVMLGDEQLFEVDVDAMVRYPLYWPGPVVEVRRALWFAPTGLGGKWIPVDAALNRQVEDGYQRVRPWQYKVQGGSAAAAAEGDAAAAAPSSPPPTTAGATAPPAASSKFKIPEHRQPLFGPYLSKFAVYLDDHSASLREDSTVAKLQLSVLSAVGAPQTAMGLWLIRGYENLPHVVKERELALAESAKAAVADAVAKAKARSATKAELAQAAAEAELAAAAAARAEEYPPAEYADPPAQPSFDHLILVVHGIGAKLSEKMEAVNFVTDVNELRKGVTQAVGLHPALSDKHVYLLPIHWRQSIQFATEAQAVESESDWSDSGSDVSDTEAAEHGDDAQPPPHSPASTSSSAIDAMASAATARKGDHRTKLPSLDELTLPGVPAIRTLVSDVVLDVLLYMTPRYRAEITHAVTREMNRVYRLFRARHPDFTGRVSIFGHSLGSIISLEILATIPPPVPPRASDEGIEGRMRADATVPHFAAYQSLLVGDAAAAFLSLTRTTPSAPKSHAAVAASQASGHGHGHGHGHHRKPDLVHTPLPPLDFAVDSFFSVGSPIGYFMLLQGERLRALTDQHPGGASTDQTRRRTVIRPRCRNLYNIFSNYDPVAVRIEPLITRALVDEQPFRVPYHKGGLTAVKQSLDNATARALDVFKSSSNFFSSMFGGGGSGAGSAAGSTEEIAANPAAAARSLKNMDPAKKAKMSRAERRQLRAAERDLRDGVSVLNKRHARVDYALQEGVLENPYLSSLSIHMAYWTDLDIAHFVANEVLKSVAEDQDEGKKRD
ncbi:hypothetical protein H9P43_001275 [Blastocladiella emersonii ATCC 22665]|nr:hypothetical protein H9P43_001275 [Blastocladiella emersonii ATCC 22665]